MRQYLTQIVGPFTTDENVLANLNNGLTENEMLKIQRLAIHLADENPLEWIANNTKGSQIKVTLTVDKSTKEFIIGQTGLLELESELLIGLSALQFNTDMPAATLIDLWTFNDQE